MLIRLFRHGLSYTNFAMSDLVVADHSATLKVTNTGSYAGAEVVQLYIACDPNASSIKRPVKELKGFTKVHLRPSECETVEIPFNRFMTAFWDEVLGE